MAAKSSLTLLDEDTCCLNLGRQCAFWKALLAPLCLVLAKKEECASQAWCCRAVIPAAQKAK